MSRREWNATIVEIQKAREVKEVTLGSFGAEVSWVLASWTNTAGEHQIELLWFANFVISVGIANVVFPTEFAQLRATVVIEL